VELSRVLNFICPYWITCVAQVQILLGCLTILYISKSWFELVYFVKKSHVFSSEFLHVPNWTCVVMSYKGNKLDISSGKFIVENPTYSKKMGNSESLLNRENRQTIIDGVLWERALITKRQHWWWKSCKKSRWCLTFVSALTWC